MSKCGYVAIVGRPNVGKSTLLNAILGQKLSITSRKPQTTRHKLLGIKTGSAINTGSGSNTNGDFQMIFVDTPGIHINEPRAINRYMNKAAKSAIHDVDVVMFLIDRKKWTKDDDLVAELFAATDAKKILVINKIDLMSNRSELLPLLESLSKKFADVEIVPISAEKNQNLDELEKVIARLLPESPYFFDEEQLTDRSERFLVSELIREKLMRQLGDELPYSGTIQIDRFDEGEELIHIDAMIFVEKDSQKRILIGKSGGQLKRIATDARKDIEKALQKKVMLNTWVKVKTGWSDDERAMRSLGYDEV